MTQSATCFDTLGVNNTICSTVGNDAIYRYATSKEISVKQLDTLFNYIPEGRPKVTVRIQLVS